MTKVQETNEELVFIEKLSKGLRFFLFFIGWIPIFLAPYELLIRPRWNGFSFYMIIPIIISIGAVAVGGLFIMAGLLGLNQTLQFHIKSKIINYSYESAIAYLRRKTFKFSDIAKSEISEHSWSDGPSTYGIQFIFFDGQKIAVGRFEKKVEAEQYLDKVEKLIR